MVHYRISGNFMTMRTVSPNNQNNKLERGSLGNNLVSQHNHLVTASYQLTLTEKKLLLACISKINSFESISSETPFSFDMVEASELFGFDMSNGGVVAAFQKAALGLMSKIVINKDVENWEATTFAHGATYNHDKKTMSILFSSRIIPYLSDLQTAFTTYRLLHIGKLNSQHAVRLYELLVMYLGINYGKPCSKKIEVEEFKRLMNCVGLYENTFSMFRAKVIEVAVDQINAETDINVKVGYSKTKRFYTHISLDFSTKGEWKDAEKEFKQVLNKDQIQKIVNNANFFQNYYSKYAHLGGVTEFLNEAKRLLAEDPKKHFSDYADYLKSE